MKRGMILSAAASVIAFAGLAFQPNAFAQAEMPLPPDSKRVEAYGAIGDYSGSEFYGNLTIIPLGGDGDGASRIVYTGPKPVVFDAEWVGRELVVFRCHHNSGAYPQKRNYFPNVLTSRYCKVMRVLDGKTVEVDLSINGGDRDFKPDGTTPSMTDASGYFFTNNREALRKAFIDPDRPKTIVLENGKTYAIRGGWGCSVAKDLVVTTRDPMGPRAAIKFSFEDACSIAPHGNAAGNCPSFLTEYARSEFFLLNENEDFSISFRNIDLLPPHYTVPLTQYGDGLDEALFKDRSNKLSRRVLEVVDSDCFREADAVAEFKLPPGMTFLLPQFAHSNGGGREGEVDYGGAVGKRKDVVGFQEFRLIRSNWNGGQVHNIKQQGPAAGNCFIAEGVSAEHPARLFPSKEAILTGQDGPGQFRLPVTITDNNGDGEFRRVNLNTDSFSWYQLANQYWVGGAVTSSFTPYIEVADPSDAKKVCRVHFGTTREFARESGFRANEHRRWPTTVIQDGFTARIFERIPKAGNVVAISPRGAGMSIKLNDTTFRLFGWALQPGDRLESGGKTFTVKSAERKHGWNKADNPATYGPGYGGEVDYGPCMYLDVALDAPVADAAPSFRVVYSKLEYLLTGEHTIRIVNPRVIGNYFCYSDTNTNFRMKDCIIRGIFRATSNYDDNKYPNDRENLARQTKFMEFTNVRMDGTEVYNQLVGNRSLADRARITGTPHRVLIDGGRFYWTGANVEFRNRPTLIYGTASYGEPRLVNPAIDGKGLVIEWGLSLQLQNGFACDLSNSTLSKDAHIPWIQVCGEGTLRIDNVRFEGKQGGFLWAMAKGFPPAIPTRLAIVGRGGEGGFRVVKELPIDGPNCSITLTDWTLKPLPYTRGEWFGVKNSFDRGAIPAENIVVNGQKPGQEPAVR